MKVACLLAVLAACGAPQRREKFPPDGSIAATRWDSQPKTAPPAWGKTVRARFFGFRGTLVLFDDAGHAGLEDPDGTIKPIAFSEPVADVEIALNGQYPTIVDRVCAVLKSGALECLSPPFHQFGRWNDLHDIKLFNGHICTSGRCYEIRHDGKHGYLVPHAGKVPAISALELDAARRTFDATSFGWRRTIKRADEAVQVDATAAPEPRVCAVLRDRTVWCFGSSFYGELGDGETNATPRLGRATIDGVVEVAVGGSTTCARTSDGRVACWGMHAHGEARFPLPPGVKTRQWPACAVDEAATERRWQERKREQRRQFESCMKRTCRPGELDCTLGCTDDPGERQPIYDHSVSCNEGGRPDFVTQPAFVPAINDAVSITASDRRICVVRGSGELTCWGPKY
jgi:hypothetical protein